MQLERARLKIRERKPAEVFDLAFVFLRMNPRVFLGMAVLGSVPMALAVYAVVEWFDDSFLVAFIGFSIAATLIRVPALLIAGRAMFVPERELLGVFEELRASASAVFKLVLWRVLLAFHRDRHHLGLDALSLLRGGVAARAAQGKGLRARVSSTWVETSAPRRAGSSLRRWPSAGCCC